MALSYADLEGLWIAAGGDPKVAATMAAIAYPESSGNPASVQQGQPYSTTGWGLWQITPGNSVPNVGIDRALLDPFTNAKAAVAKYNAQGLGAWTTYTSGAYKSYFQGNVPPNMNASSGQFASPDNTPTIAKPSILNPSTWLNPVKVSLDDFGNFVFFALCVGAGAGIVALGIFVLIREGTPAGAVGQAVGGAAKAMIGGPVGIAAKVKKASKAEHAARAAKHGKTATKKEVAAKPKSKNGNVRSLDDKRKEKAIGG